MSNIEENLKKILNSRFGKDVRQAIHDGIHDCYEDGKAGAVDLTARERIEEAITTEKSERQAADNTEKSERQAADAAEKSERMQEIAVERARIDNLVSNNNPTEGNSELIDIRIGYDGTKYGSAGEAVRGQVGSLSEDIAYNKKDIEDIQNEVYYTSKNLFDKTQVSNGYYTADTDSPTITPNETISCLLMRISEEETYTVSRVGYAFTFYNVKLNKIGIINNNDTVTTFKTPKGTRYIAVNVYNAYLGTFMLVKGDTLPSEYVAFYKYGVKNTINEIKKIIEKKEYHVGKTGNYDYNSFTDLLKFLRDDETEKTIYIHGGEYDIFEEYGGEEFAKSVSDTDWRKWCVLVPKNTKIVGVGDVVLKYMPEESQTTVNCCTCISPLNISASCQIENISIICKNCRYGIHDETSGLPEFDNVYKKYTGVIVNRYANDPELPQYLGQAYGGGWHKSPTLVFESCEFYAKNAWSTHSRNNVPENCGARIVFKNCIFKGDNFTGIQLISNSQNPPKSSVRIYNCYVSKLTETPNPSGANIKNGYDIIVVGCNDFNVIKESDIIDNYEMVKYNSIN